MGLYQRFLLVFFVVFAVGILLSIAGLHVSAPQRFKRAGETSVPINFEAWRLGRDSDDHTVPPLSWTVQEYGRVLLQAGHAVRPIGGLPWSAKETATLHPSPALLTLVKHTVASMDGGVVAFRARLSSYLGVNDKGLQALLDKQTYHASMGMGPTTKGDGWAGCPALPTFEIESPTKDLNCTRKTRPPSDEDLALIFDDPYWSDKCDLMQALVSYAYRQHRILRRYYCKHPLAPGSPAPTTEKLVEWERENQILVAFQHGGVGNRVLPLISQMVVGMLTGRAVVGPRDENWSNRESWVEPFPWSFGELKEVDAWALSGKRPPHTGVLHLSYENDTQYDLGVGISGYACGDLKTVWPEQVVSGWTENWLMPHLVYNSRYHDTLAGWFGADMDVYEPMYRFFWTPRPNSLFATKLAEYQMTHFVGNEVVAVQLRKRNIFMKKGSLEQEERMWECVESQMSQGRAMRNLRIFLATDDNEARDRAQERYGARVLTVDARGLGWPEEAVLDMSLLASAEETIYSAHSTYGYMARGIGRAPSRMLTDWDCGAADKKCREFGDGSVHGVCSVTSMRQPCQHRHTLENFRLDHMSCFDEKQYEKNMPLHWRQQHTDGWYC